MAKQETTDFYYLAIHHIHRAHKRKNELKKKPQLPTKKEGTTVAEPAKNAAIFKLRALLHNMTISKQVPPMAKMVLGQLQPEQHRRGRPGTSPSLSGHVLRQ